MARPIDKSLYPRNQEIARHFKEGVRVRDLSTQFQMTRVNIRHILRNLGIEASEGGVAISRADLSGNRFDRLTVLGWRPGIDGAEGKWACVCDCGRDVFTKTERLTSGHTKSCGCWRRDMQDAMRRRRRGPGWSEDGRQTRTYRIWSNMKARCLNPNSGCFKHYGARGIIVCERWRNSFEDFLADMGECPPGLEIDRKDVDGNYEPGNCRWATDVEQSNNMRNNRMTPSGLTVAQAARQEGIGYMVAYQKYVVMGGAPWRSENCAKARAQQKG